MGFFHDSQEKFRSGLGQHLVGKTERGGTFQLFGMTGRPGVGGV